MNQNGKLFSLYKYKENNEINRFETQG